IVATPGPRRNVRRIRPLLRVRSFPSLLATARAGVFTSVTSQSGVFETPRATLVMHSPSHVATASDLFPVISISMVQDGYCLIIPPSVPPRQAPARRPSPPRLV